MYFRQDLTAIFPVFAKAEFNLLLFLMAESSFRRKRQDGRGAAWLVPVPHPRNTPKPGAAIRTWRNARMLEAEPGAWSKLSSGDAADATKAWPKTLGDLSGRVRSGTVSDSKHPPGLGSRRVRGGRATGPHVVPLHSP